MRAAAILAIVLTLAAAAVPAHATEPFEGSVSRLDAATRDLMRGGSWHAGCPVPLDRLRLVSLTYVDLDATVRHGRAVLHHRWADEVLEVFRRLYERGFPVRRVRLVDRFDADDRVSMRHDNTSAFNCRTVAGTEVWSQHAYGRAIDINPVENPYVDGTHVSPRRGREYLDRSDLRPGMIAKRDVVWRAFHRIGWEWGGTWRSARDYQHFSANGR